MIFDIYDIIISLIIGIIVGGFAGWYAALFWTTQMDDWDRLP